MQSTRASQRPLSRLPALLWQMWHFWIMKSVQVCSTAAVRLPGHRKLIVVTDMTQSTGCLIAGDSWWTSPRESRRGKKNEMTVSEQVVLNRHRDGLGKAPTDSKKWRILHRIHFFPSFMPIPSPTDVYFPSVQNEQSNCNTGVFTYKFSQGSGPQYDAALKPSLHPVAML